MTDETFKFPPEWALNAALQRVASAATGREVPLEDIRWGKAIEQADDAVPEILFAVKGETTFNTMPLVSFVLIAHEIATEGT